MQVHHSFDKQFVSPHAVNDGVGKAVEVESAVPAPEDAPAFRIGHDPAQGAGEFIQEVVAQARLPLFVPERGRLQLLIRFRMADDARGVWREVPAPLRPRDGK